MIGADAHSVEVAPVWGGPGQMRLPVSSSHFKFPAYFLGAPAPRPRKARALRACGSAPRRSGRATVERLMNASLH